MAHPPSANHKPVSSSGLWKGKQRAPDVEFNPDDLNPVITYRHLHSSNLGARNPLRVIALCDSDAFYAYCEMVRLGLDTSLPLVVQQWDALIAVNYAAREYGISRMDKVKDAKKRCPHLNVVHVATYKEGEKEPGYWENPDSYTHKVSLDHYRRESVKIIDMFKEALPGGEIEKASIDEAFIDFTNPVRELMLARYPQLQTVPPGAPKGSDTPLPPPPPVINWEGLGKLIPVYSATDSTEPEKNGSSSTSPPLPQNPERECSITWHDIALSIGAELMAGIRAKILRELGYSTSAGVARNKFLAKLTASYRKPYGQSILRNAAIPNYLRAKPFQDIRFLGGKLGKALADEYDAETVGELLTISLEDMQRKFGENSIWVHEILRGIDRTEVKEKPPVAKSMGASKNLQHPVVKPSQGHHWVRVLAAELSLRLNEARESTPGVWPKTLSLGVRQGYDTSRSKQAPFPFIRGEITTDAIAAAGDKLWKELVGVDSTATADLKITNVHLSFNGIASTENGQKSIEGFFGSGLGATTSPTKSASSTKRRHVDTEDTENADNRVVEHVDTFTCPRCRRLIGIRLQAEHEDFHVAQDLARSINDGPSSRGAKSTTQSNQVQGKKASPEEQSLKKKARKEEPKAKGIAAFLVRR